MGVCAAAEGPRVLEVDVAGLHTIAKETCVARLQIRAGSPYLDHVASEDIRRLYALGYFTDVQVRTEALPEGMRVVFVVKEKPAIGAFRVEGNRHLRSDRVLKLLAVKKGELYNPRTLKAGVDQVKAEYQRTGYAQVAIESSATVEEAANTATVAVVIDEGPRMRIRQVLVEGNLAFSDSRIRKLLKTKRRTLFASGVYTQQVLDEDVDRVRAFYQEHGYQDIAAKASLATDPKGQGLIVLLTLEEGAQYRVGEVALTGAVLFPERELRALLRLKPGAVYNTGAVQEDLRAMKQYYGDRGYINAEIVPDTQLDDATKRVSLTYRLVEHELVYVERVDIRGNLHTKDVVVRREMRIHPGEPFNGQQIRRSLERLNNLGYFEDVSVDTQPGSAPNRQDLVVEVKEAKTGSFSFGGGFSSVDKLIGMVEVEQRNFDLMNMPSFTGAGQDLRASVEIGTIRRYFDLSFTEPWMLGYSFSFGVDAFSRTRLRSQNLGLAFEDQRFGGGLRLGKEFTETLRGGLSYQLFRTTISNVVSNASADLKAEEGSSDVSVGGVSLNWDTRDNRFDPTKGALLFSSADLAGGLLAGDRDFYRMQAGASAYWPQGERLVLEGSLRTGLVNAYGRSSEVPIFERFFAGGSNTIRGFRERRVGPRDPASNDPIGGEAMAAGTIEEVLTIVKDERGKAILKGSVFFDAGDVWRRVSDYGQTLKAGMGIGARITTPIGPVRLDLGFPINQIDKEKRRPRVHFNVSRSF